MILGAKRSAGNGLVHNFMTSHGAPLKSGEKISPVLLEKLRVINKSRQKGKSAVYYKALSEILPPASQPIDEKHKRFLAGFIIAEGSINVSAKKITAQSPRGKNSLALDPEFSVTQHLNRASHLMALLQMFGTGRIYYKSGSNATLVYVIDNRLSLEEKCIPFWEKYITPYQVGDENLRFQQWRQIIRGFRLGKHKCKKSFLEELLPLWHSLRRQQGQSNESFATLEQAREWVLSCQKH